MTDAAAAPDAKHAGKIECRRRRPVELTHEERVVIDACARAFNVNLSLLRRRDGGSAALQARTACYRLMRRSLGLSLTRVGAVLERDHTTVGHGVEQAFTRQLWSDRFVERFGRANAEVSETLSVPLAKVPDVRGGAAANALPPKAVVRLRAAAGNGTADRAASDPFAGLRFEDHPRSPQRRFACRGAAMAVP